MNKHDMDRLYKYNRWANATMMKCVSPLSTEELTRKIGGSFPSVRDTLAHMIAADWIWLRRWKGVSPKAFIDAAEFPDFAAIKEKWKEIETEQTDFINEQTDESLHQVLKYVNTKGQAFQYPLIDVMQHLVNHSSYHRGQVTNFLRQLGAQPASTDYLFYFDVEGKGD